MDKPPHAPPLRCLDDAARALDMNSLEAGCPFFDDDADDMNYGFEFIDQPSELIGRARRDVSLSRVGSRNGRRPPPRGLGVPGKNTALMARLGKQTNHRLTNMAGSARDKNFHETPPSSIIDFCSSKSTR